jgi:hypothetical protein
MAQDVRIAVGWLISCRRPLLGVAALRVGCLLSMVETLHGRQRDEMNICGRVILLHSFFVTSRMTIAYFFL